MRPVIDGAGKLPRTADRCISFSECCCAGRRLLCEVNLPLAVIQRACSVVDHVATHLADSTDPTYPVTTFVISISMLIPRVAPSNAHARLHALPSAGQACSATCEIRRVSVLRLLSVTVRSLGCNLKHGSRGAIVPSAEYAVYWNKCLERRRGDELRERSADRSRLCVRRFPPWIAMQWQ
jgi:hypothetical protein